MTDQPPTRVTVTLTLGRLLDWWGDCDLCGWPVSYRYEWQPHLPTRDEQTHLRACEECHAALLAGRIDADEESG